MEDFDADDSSAGVTGLQITLVVLLGVLVDSFVFIKAVDVLVPAVLLLRCSLESVEVVFVLDVVEDDVKNVASFVCLLPATFGFGIGLVPKNASNDDCCFVIVHSIMECGVLIINKITKP